MFFDPLYILFALPGLLLGLYAQMKVSGTYRKFAQIGSERGITGAEAARAILDRAGLPGMPIHETPGHLTDHYDPRKKALFLSGENFHGTSLAALGVSAHEAGHALQHKAAYGPLTFRMTIVPVTQIATGAYLPIIIIGFLLGGIVLKYSLLLVIGIMAILALFQLITLPVEFDASRRAKEQLLNMGLITQREHGGVSKVLNAAALTYVAAMVSAVLQLLYYLIIARSRDD